MISLTFRINCSWYFLNGFCQCLNVHHQKQHKTLFLIIEQTFSCTCVTYFSCLFARLIALSQTSRSNSNENVGNSGFRKRGCQNGVASVFFSVSSVFSCFLSVFFRYFFRLFPFVPTLSVFPFFLFFSFFCFFFCFFRFFFPLLAIFSGSNFSVFPFSSVFPVFFNFVFPFLSVFFSIFPFSSVFFYCLPFFVPFHFQKKKRGDTVRETPAAKPRTTQTEQIVKKRRQCKGIAQQKRKTKNRTPMNETADVKSWLAMLQERVNYMEDRHIGKQTEIHKNNNNNCTSWSKQTRNW